MQATLKYLMIFYLIPFPIHAQVGSCNNPGCLLPLIENAQSDTIRIKLLNQLGAYYLYKPGTFKEDMDSALSSFHTALALGDSTRNLTWQHKTLQLIGCLYFEEQNLQKGKQMFMQVVNYFHLSGDKKQEAVAWQAMAENITMNQKDFFDQKALCYEKISALYAQLGDAESEIGAVKDMADVRLNQGQLDFAENKLLEVLERYKKIGYPKLYFTYDLLGVVSTLKGNLNKALYYNAEAVRYIEKIGHTIDNEPYFYGRLARTYIDLGMYDQGLASYSAALAFNNDANKDYYYQIIVSMAKTYVLQGKPRLGERLLETTMKKKPPASLYYRMALQSAFANCYNALKEYAKAENAFLETTTFWSNLFKSNETTREELANAYLTISEFYVQNNKFTKADAYLQKILDMPAGAVNSLDLSRVQFLKFKTDSAAGNFVQSINHFEIHQRLMDSIFNTAKSKQVSELQIKYETEKKDNDLLLKSKNIQLLTNQTKLQQAQVKQSLVTRNAVAGAAVLLLILLSVGYSRYRLKQQKNLQLESKQIEITAKNFKLEKLLHENEWLMREVHHRVKNNLQIVMSLLNSQAAFLKDEAALSAMLESQQRVQSMSLIHQKLYKSSNVSTINMPEYIRDMIDYLKDSFKTKNTIYFDLQIDNIDLDVLQAVPVGLILNEVITNSIKYAFPYTGDDRISIKLSRLVKDEICLDMYDNGRGLPAGLELGKSNSFGMILINGLAEDLDGTCQISSCNGTRVTVNFKCAQIVVNEVREKELLVAV